MQPMQAGRSLTGAETLSRQGCRRQSDTGMCSKRVSAVVNGSAVSVMAQVFFCQYTSKFVKVAEKQAWH